MSTGSGAFPARRVVIFKALYRCARLIARHENGPLLESRRRHLEHLAYQGAALHPIRATAGVIYRATVMMKLDESSPVEAKDIERTAKQMGHRCIGMSAAEGRKPAKSSEDHLQMAAVAGRLRESDRLPAPYQQEIDALCRYMAMERCLSPATIATQRLFASATGFKPFLPPWLGDHPCAANTEKLKRVPLSGNLIHRPIVFAHLNQDDFRNPRPGGSAEQHDAKSVNSGAETLTMRDLVGGLRPGREELLKEVGRGLATRGVAQHHDSGFVVLHLPGVQEAVGGGQSRGVVGIRRVGSAARRVGER